MTKIIEMFLIIFTAFTMLACGSTPKAGPEMHAMLSLAEFANQESRPTALVQFAFLYSGAGPATITAKLTAEKQGQLAQENHPYVVWVGKPVDEGLPMPLATFSDQFASPKVAKLFMQTRSVLLARYLGPTRGNGEHVSSFLKFSRRVSGSPDFVLDLSTRRAYTIEDFDRLLSSEGEMLAEQVIPGVERADDGTITFYTRGMAKFALPDLEQSGVSTQEAKRRFKMFQRTITIALEKTVLKQGSELDGHLLSQCQRNETAIERECVHLGPNRANRIEN